MSSEKTHDAIMQDDIIVSTRIRLARNLVDIPFPNRLTAQQMREVSERVQKALEESDANFLKDYRVVNMDEIAPNLAVSLVEQHVISPEFAKEREGRTLILRKDNIVSIMICEEDHLRIQTIQDGFKLKEAYDEIQKIDDLLSTHLPFAFDKRLGYLTQCPTNLGTGMRASILLHLPALHTYNQMSRLASGVSKLGLTIRGNYGEGSSPSGDFYQLSNQITLGISEEVAIQNLGAITLQLARQEKEMQEQLLKTDDFQDKLGRALGILQHAHVLSNDEFMKRISLIRIGISNNLITGDALSTENIDELIQKAQPASISMGISEEISQKTIELERAKLTRQTLKNATIQNE